MKKYVPTCDKEPVCAETDHVAINEAKWKWLLGLMLIHIKKIIKKWLKNSQFAPQDVQLV